MVLSDSGLTAGRVGIGTSSASVDLEVSSASYPQLRVTDSAASVSTKVMSTPTTGNIGTHTNHDLQIITNNTERLRVDSSGNLGIGTSAPDYTLHVSGANAQIGLTDTNVTNATWRLLAQTGNTTKLFRIYDSSNAADRLVINGSGNVGIGTSSPSYLLQVTSSGTSSETVAAFGNASISEGLQIETNGNLDWGFNALNSRNLTFSTNQTEAARFDSVGRFIAGHSASVPTVIPGYSTNYHSKTQLVGTSYSDNCWLTLSRFSTSTSAPMGS